MIEARNLTLIYRDVRKRERKVLTNITFDIPEGRITSFIGKSGAGKTSILRCIANLSSTYEGTLLFRGKSIKKLSPNKRVSHIGYVFQQFNLFPHMTALENCMHPLVNAANTQTSCMIVCPVHDMVFLLDAKIVELGGIRGHMQ